MRGEPVIKVTQTAYGQEVTGSMILQTVEFPDGRTERLLIDCGANQEPEHIWLNYLPDVNPENVDVVFLTHPHFDHIGLVPKLVRGGYNKPIYMTKAAKELVCDFWMDSSRQQENTAREMRERFPSPKATKILQPLYNGEDVKKTMELCEGMRYRETREVRPGVKVTFIENAHLIGAGMILVQYSYPEAKTLNYLFTGDFKFESRFMKVPELPEWLTDKEIIMVIESTYGSTRSEEIKRCFTNNMLEAFARRQSILLGGFAQGRMQDILFDLKLLQDENSIPEEYEIWIDGSLGISTTAAYVNILTWLNPEKSDFLPKGIKVVNPKKRAKILEDGVPKIVVTTSGMLTRGPSRQYVPIFLRNPNALIHLVGYAAEGTLARSLLEAKSEDYVNFGGAKISKKCVIKSTREFSSHAPMDELLRLIKMFKNIRFLGINHGESDTKQFFEKAVHEECPNVAQTGIMDRTAMFRFSRTGDGEISVKAMPSKLVVDCEEVLGPETDKTTILKNRAAAKNAAKEAKARRAEKKDRKKGNEKRKKENRRR